MHAESGELSANSIERIHDLIFKSIRWKILQLGGCSLLKIEMSELMNVKKRPTVRIIMGFNKDVYPIEAIAFKILLFKAFQKYLKPKLIHPFIYKEHPILAEKLGFVLV
jgi:hypothetical protein